MPASLPRFLTALACAFSMIAPARALAQTCAGGPSFAQRAVQFDAGALTWSPHRALGLQLSGGAAGGFVRLGVGTENTWVRDREFIASEARLGAGMRIRVGALGRAEVCPLLQFAYAEGPRELQDFDLGNRLIDRLSSGLGVAVGAEYRAGRMLRLIPALQVGMEFEQSAFSGRGSDPDTTSSETYGYAAVALGMSFGSFVTVRPSVTLPYATRGRDPLVGVTVGVGFLRRRP